MKNTIDLIASLSAEAKLTKKVKTPSFYAISLLSVLAIYAMGCQLFLGFRPDLALQLTRPLFVLECLLLILLILSSVFAATLAMYPDAYQKPQFLKLPYYIFILLVIMLCFQIFIPIDTRMVILEEPGIHDMECAICIASAALIPSVLIFALLRKGASVRQFQAGSLSVLAASGIGGLTLRFAEANDSIIHLVQWHYAPTVLLAALGTFVGKWLLKW